MNCGTVVNVELTSGQVAEALDVHRHTALRWLERGIIAGGYQKRPGGYWFILESDLREYLHANNRPTERLDKLLESL